MVRLRFVACVHSAVRFWKTAEQSNTPSTFLVARVSKTVISGDFKRVIERVQLVVQISDGISFVFRTRF